MKYFIYLRPYLFKTNQLPVIRAADWAPTADAAHCRQISLLWAVSAALSGAITSGSVWKDDKQAGSKPFSGFIGGGGLDDGGSPALLLAGLCSDCVINERSLCWRVCGTEESQRPKHHKGEKNEVRLLPGSKIQPRVTLLLHRSWPNGPCLGLFCLPTAGERWW